METPKKIIRFCYRKVIDASSQKTWDQYVFDSTYKEFLLQSQFYNREKKYTAFSDMLVNNGAAEKLHFLVSAAVVGYLQQLNSKVPDILNNLGKQCLQFNQYKFEIINSDTKNKKNHQVAINFYSEPMIWHDMIDGYMLVSLQNPETAGEEIFPDMITAQPFLSIYSLKTIAA